MAQTVLLIVTIPTKEEEVRLKTEFIAKKLEQRSDQADPKFATPIGSASTVVSPASAYTTPTAPPPLADVPELVDYDEESVSGLNFETNQAADDQYGTFPKRRKSAPKLKTVDDATTPTNSMRTSASAANSLKDMDADGPEPVPSGERKQSEGLLRDLLYSNKRKSQKRSDAAPLDLDQPSDASMELVMREILKKFQVGNDVWSLDSNKRIYQIVFTMQFDETYETLLDKLHEWGIGERVGSTVSVLNCLASKSYTQQDDSEFQEEEDKSRDKQGAWDRFMNSVSSRLSVKQIVDNVRRDAAITFDFLVLLISAAILAAFGLVENSTVFLAASMLISPLMGPIIAGIFGTVIKDSRLCYMGVKNELIGILSAVLVGFTFGMIVGTIDDRYGVGEGLTQEMQSRCELHSLLVGVFTAIPSGAAAAVGILGGNVGSLVGVAISASLLPPAVNSGLLWALACMYKIFERDETRYSNVVKTNFYSDDQAAELAIMGTISMCLTISNVICVYFMGILVLKIKEIAPISARNNNQFWKYDVKIARDMRGSHFDPDNAFIDEWANLPSEDQKALGISSEALRNMRLDDASYQHTWSPQQGYLTVRDPYSTVHQQRPRLDRMYSTITRQDSRDPRRNRFSMTRRYTGRASDMNTNYMLLTEQIPRCTTMPGKGPSVTIVEPSLSSNRSSLTNTLTNLSEESRRRKFIVTPADHADPLLKPSDESNA